MSSVELPLSQHLEVVGLASFIKKKKKTFFLKGISHVKKRRK
jgi:hypothetical protein